MTGFIPQSNEDSVRRHRFRYVRHGTRLFHSSRHSNFRNQYPISSQLLPFSLSSAISWHFLVAAFLYTPFSLPSHHCGCNLRRPDAGDVGLLLLERLSNSRPLQEDPQLHLQLPKRSSYPGKHLNFTFVFIFRTYRMSKATKLIVASGFVSLIILVGEIIPITPLLWTPGGFAMTW